MPTISKVDALAALLHSGASLMEHTECSPKNPVCWLVVAISPEEQKSLTARLSEAKDPSFISRVVDEDRCPSCDSEELYLRDPDSDVWFCGDCEQEVQYGDD